MHDLVGGQMIEFDMAHMMGVKVFQVYCPDDYGCEMHFTKGHIDLLLQRISQWYDDHCCSDRTVTVVRQAFGCDDGFDVSADESNNRH